MKGEGECNDEEEASEGDEMGGELAVTVEALGEVSFGFKDPSASLFFEDSNVAFIPRDRFPNLFSSH